MLKKIRIIFAILNGIVGCFAGIYLVSLTSNYWFYLINAITGATSGFMLSTAILEDSE